MNQRHSRRSPKRPRLRSRPDKGRSANRRRRDGLSRHPRVALGYSRTAKGRERAVHRAGFVAVFAVASVHFAPVAELLRLREMAKKITLAFLFDNRAEADIAAGAVFA